MCSEGTYHSEIPQCNCQLLPVVQRLIDKYKFIINDEPNLLTEKNRKNISHDSALRENTEYIGKSKYSVSPNSSYVSRGSSTIRNGYVKRNDVPQTSNDKNSRLKTDRFTQDIQLWKNNIGTQILSNDSKNAVSFSINESLFQNGTTDSSQHIFRIPNRSCPVHSNNKSMNSYALKIFNETSTGGYSPVPMNCNTISVSNYWNYFNTALKDDFGQGIQKRNHTLLRETMGIGSVQTEKSYTMLNKKIHEQSFTVVSIFASSILLLVCVLVLLRIRCKQKRKKCILMSIWNMYHRILNCVNFYYLSIFSAER